MKKEGKRIFMLRKGWNKIVVMAIVVMFIGSGMATIVIADGNANNEKEIKKNTEKDHSLNIVTKSYGGWHPETTKTWWAENYSWTYDPDGDDEWYHYSSSPSGHGMHCDDYWDVSDMDYIYYYVHTNEGVKPGSLKIGAYFDADTVPWNGGPDLWAYNYNTEKWVRIKQSMGSPDGYVWKWYSVSNDYLNPIDPGGVYFCIVNAAGCHTMLDLVGLKFIAPDEEIYNATYTTRDDNNDGYDDGVDIAIDADVGDPNDGTTVDVTAVGKLLDPIGSVIDTDSATWTITDWQTEYGYLTLSALGGINGDYTMQVTLYDEYGNNESYAYGSVTLYPEGVNQPPVADAGGPYSGNAGESISFDASGSYDPDGSITGYRWDWTNDGSWDTGWLSSPYASHTYPTEGTYTVKVQVEDDDGATDTDTASVSVGTGIQSPSVRTDPASNVGAASATLNGYLINDGGESCQIRFRIRESGGSWWYVSGWHGSYTSGMAFSEQVNGLDEGVIYEFQAGAKNSAGEDWGSIKQFTTAQPPSIISVESYYADGSSVSGENGLLLAGLDLENTYTAIIGGGGANWVRFDFGTLSYNDSNPSDGWSADFNMEDIGDSSWSLTVTAGNQYGTDSETYYPRIIMMPDWLSLFVEYTQTWSYKDYISFSVSENYVPGEGIYFTLEASVDFSTGSPENENQSPVNADVPGGVPVKDVGGEYGYSGGVGSSVSVCSDGTIEVSGEFHAGVKAKSVGGSIGATLTGQLVFDYSSNTIIWNGMWITINGEVTIPVFMIPLDICGIGVEAGVSITPFVDITFELEPTGDPNDGIVPCLGIKIRDNGGITGDVGCIVRAYAEGDFAVADFYTEAGGSGTLSFQTPPNPTYFKDFVLACWIGGKLRVGFWTLEGWYRYEWKWSDYNLQIYNATYNETGWHPLNTSYLNQNPYANLPWTGGSFYNGTLVENAFPYANPSIAYNPNSARGNEAMVVFAHDNSQNRGDPLQQMELLWGIWNENTGLVEISTIPSTHDDGKLQIDPQIAYDANGNVVCVFIQTDDSVSINTSVADAFNATEIAYCVYDKDSGEWGNIIQLTNNTKMDVMPKLCSNSNGDIMLVWVSDADANYKTIDDRTFYASFWNGNGWSDPVIILQNYPVISGPSIAIYNNSEAICTFSSPVGNKEKIFYVRMHNGVWGDVTQFTYDAFFNETSPSAVYGNDGTPYIVWLKHKYYQENINATIYDGHLYYRPVGSTRAGTVLLTNGSIYDPIAIPSQPSGRGDIDFAVGWKSGPESNILLYTEVSVGSRTDSSNVVYSSNKKLSEVKWCFMPSGVAVVTTERENLTNGGIDCNLTFIYRNLAGNSPPNTPSNPSPSDGEVAVNLSTTLSWMGGDPDGDIVTYDVYLEANNPDPQILISSDQQNTSYHISDLNPATTYYWKIVATDNHSHSTEGPIWSFTTEEMGIEFIPPIFEGFEDGIMPPDNWTVYNNNTDHPWTIVDAATYPEYVHNGDYAAWINYDIYNSSDNWLYTPYINLTGFTNMNLSFWAITDTNWPSATMKLHVIGDGFDDVIWDLIADENWPTFEYRQKTLRLDSYCGQLIKLAWQYVGIDGESFGLDDIWITGATLPEPPAIPSQPSGPTCGEPGVSYQYQTSTTDPDGDGIFYKFDWDDNTDDGWLGPYSSGETVTASHSWNQPGLYYVRVKAKDENGLESDWSEPLPVEIGTVLLSTSFEDEWVDEDPDGDGYLVPATGWDVDGECNSNQSGWPNLTHYWSQYDNSDYPLAKSGNYCAGLWWSDGNGGDTYQNEWLITPAIDCSNYEDVYLSFYGIWYWDTSTKGKVSEGKNSIFGNLRNKGGNHNYVKISTDNGNTWTTLADLLNDPEYEQGIGGPAGYGWCWNEYKVILNLSSYADGESCVKIAWQAVNDSGGTLPAIFMIDDVAIAGIFSPSGQPQLSYSPTSHDFGNVQEGKIYQTTFEIWNSGTGTLTWSLTDSYSWLTYSPTSGSSTGEHDTVTVTIDTTGLSPGSYSGSISISSNGGDGTFTVTFTIPSSIWSASTTAEETGGSGETFIFGESGSATDGNDGPPLDIQHAPYPPPDLVIYSMMDGTKYAVDTKYGPDTSKIWDVYVEWKGSGSTTVTLTWDVSQIPSDEYASVILYDVESGTSTNMRSESSYGFTINSDETHHFKIICSNKMYITTLTKKAGASYGWNLFGLPFNQSINLGDLEFNYQGTSYTFYEASSQGLIYGVIYDFDRESQQYTFLYQNTDTINPGYGYWIKVFVQDIELWYLPSGTMNRENNTPRWSSWTANISAFETGGSGETFIFGESGSATDGNDGPPLDIQHAPYPPPDLVIYSMMDGTKYAVDTKYGPDTSKIWDVYVEWKGSGSTTVTLTWDVSQIPSDEYASVILYDDATGASVNMRNGVSYSYSCSAGESREFYIMCLPPTTDYILITYRPGGIEIPNQSISTNFGIDAYASAYNNTFGYIGPVSVNWSILNYGSNATINATQGKCIEFNSGNKNGIATLIAEYNGLNDTVVFNINSSMFSFMLHQGWNFVTLPCENNYTASSLYNSIQGCNLILKWNNSKNDFDVYVPGSPNNFAIENGIGYFISVDYDTIFSLLCNPIQSVNITLLVGWNSLGWFKEEQTNASNIYNSISGCNIVLRWNNSRDDFDVYVPGAPDFVIEQGNGFFVSVSQQSQWHG